MKNLRVSRASLSPLLFRFVAGVLTGFGRVLALFFDIFILFYGEIIEKNTFLLDSIAAF
jgi:hypothetical protein